MKIIFGCTMIALLLPFVVAALLADMTKKIFLLLVGSSIFAILLFYLSETNAPFFFEKWFSVDAHRRIAEALSVVCGGLILIMMMSHRSNVRNRMAWAPTLSQNKMERLAVDSLKKQGWNISSDLASVAGISIYRCSKGRNRIFALIIKELTIPFSTFTASLERVGGLLVSHVVIAYYEKPSEALVKAGESKRMMVIYYKDLASMDRVSESLYTRNAKWTKAEKAALSARIET